MLIGQDVEDLLFQLVRSHMISVLCSTDEVIAHFLLLSPVRGILGTVGLEESGRQRVKQETVRNQGTLTSDMMRLRCTVCFFVQSSRFSEEDVQT